jgi:Transposase DDE domain
MSDFSIVSQLDAWAGLVERLGGASGLEASARRHGALKRRREVKSAEDLLRLLLAYGPGGRSLRMMSAEAAGLGICDISDVALFKRFRGCGDWMTALCEGLLAAGEPIGVDGGAREGGAGAGMVRLVDASRIEGPGDSCWRLHLLWDAERQRISDIAVTALAQGERLGVLKPRPGELRIGDRGYPHADGLSQMRQAGADVLVRLTWNSLRLVDEAGGPLDWQALFDRAGQRGCVDMPVKVTKPRGRFEPLPLRLVISPKPPQTIQAARKRTQRAADKDQRQPGPLTLAAAEHMILITSLSADAFPPERLCALYRVRWQVELAFKRLKSILRLDRLPAKDAGLAKAWITAHLLLALFIEDTAAELAESPPSATRH